MEANAQRVRFAELMQVALRELDRMGGSARAGELFERVSGTARLTEHEQAPLEKSGHVRWRARLHFQSIACVKAGFLQKSAGRWHLTDEGRSALQLPAREFLQAMRQRYLAWKRDRSDADDSELDEEPVEDTDVIVRQTAYEQAVEQARVEIENHIAKLGPYDFQRLVAELLIAMGYHVPFVAPPGRDGGIDLVAYRDPLGTSSPRIKVQVKHRDRPVTVREVREMEGLLRKDGDIGLFASSGGFSSEVEREIRSSMKHIETMDLDRLISLWEQHYDGIRQGGKALLPLVRLSFLAPAEE
jgi:restriction system protein